MRKITFLIGIIGLAIGLAACGSSGDSPPGTSYYLASDSNAVLLITWNASGTGTITYDSVNTGGSDPSAPDSLSVNSDPVGVTISGSAITFTGFLGATFNGSLDGGTLTITSPPDSSTGQITTDTLSASDPAAYNAAVSTLNRTITAVNAQAAQAYQQQQQIQASASASQAQAQQDQQDQQQASSDISTLASDVQSMQGDLQSMGGDVSSAASDLQSLKNDAAQGQGSNCENVSTTVYNDAATTLYNDEQTTILNDLQTTLSNDLSTVRGDISTVQGDLQKLQQDGVPTPPSGIGAARSAIASVIQQANANNATVAGYVDTGYQIANGLAYGACAGMGPGNPPTPPANLS